MTQMTQNGSDGSPGFSFIGVSDIEVYFDVNVLSTVFWSRSPIVASPSDSFHPFSELTFPLFSSCRLYFPQRNIFRSFLILSLKKRFLLRLL